MSKTTLTRVNGMGKENGTISRKVLERNVMDIITGRGYTFDDCLDFAEESSKQTLINFLREYDLADDYESVLHKYMTEFLGE